MTWTAMKWITLALAIAVSLLLGMVFFVVEGHPVSSSALSQFQVGMTKEQVRQAFGSPTSVKLDELRLAERWRYSGMTWCMVDVQFDQQGAATEIIHDH